MSFMNLKTLRNLKNLPSAKIALLVLLTSGATLLSEAASAAKICGHNASFDWDPVPNPVYDRKYRTIKTLCVTLDQAGKATSVSAFPMTDQVFTYSVIADQVLSDWRGNEYREVKLKPIAGSDVENPWVRIVYFPENPSQVMSLMAITPDGYDVTANGQVWTE